MKVLRSTLVIGLAAFAAACGDKVTVAGPPTSDTAPKVNSVTVAPSNVTLTVGQTVSFTAVVDVSNGAAQTVTWSSSASNVTVSTAGVATAVSATPGVAVCATSTADATKKGCAQVVVTAAAPVVPATVSIQSITIGCSPTTVPNCGLNVPANPAAIAGQVDVRLNINPGNQTVTKVQVYAGSTLAGEETFTGAQAAALRFAADEAAVTQSTFPSVVFPINTAAFNATTGAVTYANGAYPITARLYTSAGGSTTPASTASFSSNVTFANVNAFAATVTNSGTTATSANNAAGFKFNRGGLSVSIVPVSYNGVALAAGTVNFGLAACDGSGSAQRTLALTAPSAGSSAWTATFTHTPGSGAAAGDLDNYSFNPAGGGCTSTLTTGETVTIVAAQGSDGNAFTTTALPITAGSAFRMDNLAPAVPALAFTVAARRNNLSWVNDALPFNRTAGSAGAGAIVAAVADGTGGIGLSTDETLVYQTTVGGAVLTNSATLAESATNATYSGTATARDLLGNTSAASAAATFGVDRTAPTFTTAAPAAGTLGATTPSATTIGAFTYSDAATLPAGPSTPSATPVRLNFQRRTTATASTRWNTGSAAYNSTGAEFSAGLAGIALDPSAANTQAYYVVTMFVEDGAANPSLSVVRTYLYDATAPTGPFAIPVMTTSAGLTGLFTSTLGDNLDIQSSQWGHNYAVMDAAPGAAGSRILAAATTFGAFESFTTTASSSDGLPLLRSMMNNAGGVPAFGTIGSLVSVTHTVMDRSGVAGGTVAVTNAVPGANLPALPTTDPYATSLAFTGAGGFSVTNTAVTVDISGNGTAPTLNSVDLTATAVGTVNTALNPFSRVEFYVYNPTANTYHLLGTATTPTVVDNATNRVYTWTVNWNPDAVGSYNNPNAAGLQTVVAIGINATHDGVRTAGNATITTTP
jgi:hypothetical protein